MAKRLLYLEDNDQDALTFQSLLKEATDEDIELLYYNSLEEALEEESDFDSIYAIYSDLNLPGIKGEDLINRILSSWADLPIAFITREEDSQIAVQLMRAGAIDYISKSTLSVAKIRKSLQIIDRFKQYSVQKNREIQSFEHFSSQNPYPVLRVNKDKEIIYHNQPANPILDLWNQTNSPFEKVKNEIVDILADPQNSEKHIEVIFEDKIFDFALFPLHYEGYVNIFGFDITQQRETQNKYESVVESISDIIFQVSLDGKITFVNSAWEQISGYTVSESLGKPAINFVPKDKQEELRHLFYSLRTRGNSNIRYRLHVTNKKNEEKIVEIFALPKLKENGEIESYSGTISDITQHVKHKKEIQELTYALEQSADGFAVLNKEGRYTYLNDAHVKMFGFDSAEELIAQKWETLYTDDQIRHINQDIFPKLTKNGQWNGEIVGKKKDGSPIGEDLSLTLTPDGGLICFCRDNTERKKTELEKQKHAEFIRTVLDTNPNLIFAKNIEGRFTLVNKAVSDLYNISSEKLIGKTDADFISVKEEIEYFDKIDKEVINHKKTIRTEETLTIDGVTNWFDTIKTPLISIDGSTQVLGISSNITKRKEAEEKIKESERQLAEAQKLAKVGSWSFDIITQKVRWSEEHARIYEWTRKEPPNVEEFFQLVHEDYHDLIKQAFQEATSLGKAYKVDLKITTINGKEKYINTLGQPQLDEEGKVIKIFGTTTDITERKKAEQQIKQSLEKEIKLNQLKSEFVSMASHQFRTPLTIIKSNVELMQMQCPVEMEEKRKAFLMKCFTRVNQEIDRMTTLMNEVLTLGKIEAQKIDISPEEFEVEDYFNTIIDKYEHFDEEKRSLQLKTPMVKGRLNADKQMLDHAVTNIISNAFKYSKGKSAPEFFIEVNTDQQLQITVKDFGIGIPQREQINIFNSFFRASNTQGIQGTGLGLVIAKQLIEMHKGDIQLESVPNKGTTCIITLPFVNHE